MDDIPAYDRLNTIYDRFQADLDPVAWAAYIHGLYLGGGFPTPTKDGGSRCYSI